jgi:hypothetical protein
MENNVLTDVTERAAEMYQRKATYAAAVLFGFTAALA